MMSQREAPRKPPWGVPGGSLAIIVVYCGKFLMGVLGGFLEMTVVHNGFPSVTSLMVHSLGDYTKN